MSERASEAKPIDWSRTSRRAWERRLWTSETAQLLADGLCSDGTEKNTEWVKRVAKK